MKLNRLGILKQFISSLKGESPEATKKSNDMVVTFEMSLRCNLLCKMCYIPEEKLKYSKDKLGLEDIKKVILHQDIHGVTFIGGEVFMLPDVADTCHAILKESQASLHITTNGTIFKPEIFKKNREYILNERLAFTVSIDGKSEIHNSIRGKPGAFSMLEKTMERYRELCREIDIPFEKTFGINCTIQKSNYRQLRDVLDVARDLGLRKIAYTNLLFATREEIEKTLEQLPYDLPKEDLFGLMIESQDDLPDGKFVRQELEDIMANNEDLRIKLGKNTCLETMEEHYSFDFKPNLSMRCPHRRVRIDSDGNLIFCKLLRAKIGNIFEKPWEELWGSDEMKKGQKAFDEAGAFPICYRCTKEKQLPPSS